MSGNAKYRWFLQVYIFATLFIVTSPIAFSAPTANSSEKNGALRNNYSQKDPLQLKLNALFIAEFGKLALLFPKPIDPSNLKGYLDPLATNPNDYKSRFISGFFNSQTGQYKKSFNHFKEGVVLKKDFLDKLFPILFEYIKRDPFVKIFFDKKLEDIFNDIKNHDVFLNLVTYALVFNKSIMEKPEKVISESKKINSDKSNFSLRYATNLFIASIYAVNEQPDKSIFYLENAATLKPDWVLSHILRGISYAVNGNKYETIASIKKAILLEPKEFYARFLLCGFQEQFKQYSDAIASCKQGLQIRPYHTATHYVLGDIYRELGQYRDAIASYKEGLRIGPGYAEAHFHLGFAYRNLKQYRDAIASYKEAIRIKPDHASAHNNLGLVYEQLGYYHDAITSYKEALKINPNDTIVHTNLDHLEKKLANEAQDRRLEKKYRLEEEKKKHQTLKNFKEADRLVHERRLIEKKRKKLETLLRKKEIQERQKREVLRIDEEKRKQQPKIKRMYSGTGFLFSDKDYVITNWHIVRGANNIKVKFINGEKIKAEVAVKDIQNDIAFLKLERQPQLPPSDLKIGDSSKMNISDEVFTIGYPAHWLLGENPKYARGEVNALSGMKDDPRVFQISVQIQPGNSGGPLFNSSGEVIGITCASLDPKVTIGIFDALPQNVNYAIKSSYISALLPMLPETFIASRSIVAVPKEYENNRANFIEKTKKNIVLIEANRF